MLTLGQIIPIMFGAGLLASFSPCLFPVMPTYLSIIAQDNKSSRLRILGSMLALMAGILIVFSIISLVITETVGQFILNNYRNFAIFQAVLTIAVGGILIYTPKFMYNIKLPQFFEDFMYSDNVQNRTIYLSFIMGLAYTIIATPCAIGYFLGAISSVIGQTIFVKLLGFTFFSMGASLPFLLLALIVPEIKENFVSGIQKGSFMIKLILGVLVVIAGIWLLVTVL